MQKRADKPTKGFYVNVREQLHKDFKSTCAKNGDKMQDVIEKMFIEYISKNK